MYKASKILAIIALFAILSSSNAKAEDLSDVNVGEGYAAPTFRELYSTVTMMGGVNIDEGNVVDEYARLNYCADFQKYFKNDYEWNLKRQEIRKRVKEKSDPYRVLYEIVDPIEIERYDFDNGYFPIKSNNSLANISKMQLFDSDMLEEGYCGAVQNIGSIVKVFPTDVNLTLDKPFNLTKIKVRKENVQAMSDMMGKFGVLNSRKIYAVVRFKVKDAMAVDAVRGRTNLYGMITGVDFYYDDKLSAKISFIEGYN